MPLQPGQGLNNRYRIVKLLGQGGFGAVYRAWDTSLSRPCALKENLDTSSEAQRQFNREATLLANLSHPNLPRVTDYFFLPEQGQYLVMDLVEGEDLGAMLQRLGQPLAEADVLPWIAQVCEALTYLHSQNPPVIHRDIKPANIKITPTGKAMLVDFGIAKVYDPHLQTTVGARAVTPGYSPPEQYGHGTTDARTDVHALGATLYTLLTAKEPPESVLRSTGAELPQPRSLNPSISTPVAESILRAMELAPTARFQSSADFRAAITAAPVGSAPALTLIYPAHPQAPPAQPRRSLPWLWVIAGGLLLLLICAAGLFAGSTVLAGGARRSATRTAAALAMHFTETAHPAELTPTGTSPGQAATATFPPAATPTPTLPVPTTPFEPTFTPRPVPSPTPSLPAIVIKPMCREFKESPVYVQQHQPVTLWWYWAAKTRKQVRDHLDAANFQIHLDGREIVTYTQTEIELVKDKDLGEIYRVSWYAEVGPLAAGSHQAERLWTWDFKIFDGWQSYGPGSPNETEWDDCEIIVR